ncbi:MAG: hypothetical protein IKD88_06640 [Lachnospiraceae bacterium]|nr:hypothetical protein [Lachnospiraceae bacterium]
MYSVLIQNSKTIDSFLRYRPFFAEALTAGQIGICRWNEFGRTIETALPELSSLTDDKEEWRAIIVRHTDDHDMSAFESADNNPYDFEVNRDLPGFEENEVPLVRLTQMLGGVPPVEVSFEAEVIQEEHMQPRTVYHPVKNAELIRQRDALAEFYEFDGRKPSSILIISMRRKPDQDEKLAHEADQAWKKRKESWSSEFWKRNQYPSACRFLVYDYEFHGPVQREADDFNFWLSVLLLSLNKVDASTLQAYRLYTVRTILDKDAMKRVFQEQADLLRDSKKVIQKEIRKQIEGRLVFEEELPDYRLDVPVVLNLPKRGDIEVSPRSFPFLSEGQLADFSVWRTEKNRIEEHLVRSVRSANRSLDQTAARMRNNLDIDEAEAEPLNRYQVEDLTRETDQLYRDIVKMQGSLPTEDVSADPKIVQVTNEIQDELSKRVMKGPVLFVGVMTAVLLVMAAFPAVIRLVNGTENRLTGILIMIIFGAAAAAIDAIIILALQKHYLNKLILRYDQIIADAFNELEDDADQYTKYLSSIASHSRGIAHLDMSSRLQITEEEQKDDRFVHIRAINAFLGRLKQWGKAQHLNLDLESRRPDSRITVDTTVSPADNKLYVFEAGKYSPVEINHSGLTMQSPYSFTKKIEILREELYDDERD